MISMTQTTTYVLTTVEMKEDAHDNIETSFETVSFPHPRILSHLILIQHEAPSESLVYHQLKINLLSSC